MTNYCFFLRSLLVACWSSSYSSSVPLDLERGREREEKRQRPSKKHIEDSINRFFTSLLQLKTKKAKRKTFVRVQKRAEEWKKITTNTTTTNSSTSSFNESRRSNFGWTKLVVLGLFGNGYLFGWFIHSFILFSFSHLNWGGETGDSE